MKKVRLTLCTLGTASFFTLIVSEILESRRNATCEVRKLTVAKRQNRAGATPLFCGESAQKFCRVAPALRHEFPCRPFVHSHGNPQEEEKKHKENTYADR